ncbi:PhaM family polyhydroxyalkanoate granule multifunctional regulatory protein [Massilia sp. Se16.2.3]|uniref:PhaM family polyhydroxyalkanoate granule multifunctional regulatory protein n=1 Tax=Massilia sp. Se16.2.3 TaxID=2709303 RepID=UPI0016006971|nr:PhaM family polyhydroxyalkanoate granule multifunctional regulatory protein [Massilia sp. Se16.2.3]
MLKPPSQNVPGMTDTLEFVKNLWGGMGVPGVGMSGMGSSSLGVPSMSTEDLDKRIADLKAVESWLNLNLSMLRTSIQALEVQRGTLAALKSMSDSMAQAMSKPGEQTASLPPFAAFFGANGAPRGGTGAAAAQPGADAPAPDAAMPAAVAWWNMLQDQFRQAVSSAMPADGTAGNQAAQVGARPTRRRAPPRVAMSAARQAPRHRNRGARKPTNLNHPALNRSCRARHLI